jgi:hypothetical protein
MDAMRDHDDYLWEPRGADPDLTIVALERALAPYRFTPARVAPVHPLRFALRRVRWAPVAAAVAVLAGSSVMLARPDRWSIAAEGLVSLAGSPVTDDSRLTIGGRLETGAASAATVRLGGLGEVRLGQQTSLELQRADGQGQHYLLRHGELHARIWAKPRFFEVATATVRAIDLGCIYTIRVDERGAGEVVVEFGAVELVAGSARTLVPAGNRATFGTEEPSVPSPTGRTREFREAARALATGRADADDALMTVLAATDGRSSITSWHLLPLVHPSYRSRLLDHLARHAGASPAAHREALLALDPGALDAWREVLEPLWTTEPGGPLRRSLVRWRLAKPYTGLLVPERGS